MRLFTLLVLLMQPLLLCAHPTLVIENVNIISAHTQSSVSPQRQMHVAIIDGRISQISPSKIAKTIGEQRIDGKGQFLVPGIMDSHVHVSSVPGMGFGEDPVTKQNAALAERYFTQQPNSLLYHGVTQILDPNPGANWQKFTRTNTHPDFFRCEVITSTQSFPFVEKPRKNAAAIFKYLVDENNTNSKATNSPESLVKAIAQSGAICVKLYFEDGYGNASQWPLLPQPIIKRIVQAAHQHHLPVLAHANALDMYQAAIQSDVDVIAHGMWNWGKERWAGKMPEAITSVLKQLNAKDIGYMPTLRLMSGLGELMVPDTLANPAYLNVTPKPLLNWYRQPAADWFKQELIAGFDHLPANKIAEIIQYGQLTKGRQVMQYLHQSGKPLLLGSDTPGSPSFINQPGLTTFLEMKAMADADIPLADILAAATINNARRFNLDSRYGSVEVGKVANLLLLKANPLKTIEAWDKISQVILGGQVLQRETLKAGF